MKKKDANVIKILTELGLVNEERLTPEQEEMFQRAVEPENFFFDDIENLFRNKS